MSRCRSVILGISLMGFVAILGTSTLGQEVSKEDRTLRGLGSSKTSTGSAPQVSFWYNLGDGQFDPDLGEFHTDIGGMIDFGRYVPGHPYHGLKADIARYFFDHDQLDVLLGGLEPPDIVPRSTGSYSVYYLAHDVRYETLEVNGALLSLIWDETVLLPNPQLFLQYQSGNGAHGGPKQFVFVGGDYEPGHGRDFPPDWFDGRPLPPPEQAVASGHYLAVLTPNRWPDLWLAIQRGLDVVRYLRSRPDLTFERAFTHGGSWEGNQAVHAALFAPRTINGALGPFFLDMAYESPQGGWTKLLQSFYTALGRGDEGTAVPSRAHSIDGYVFGMPTLRVADLADGWEYAAYSILQRKDLPVGERLQRPIRWFFGNCDIYHNGHFYMDRLKNDPALQAFTGSVGTLQLLGHGGEAAGPNNHQYFYDGTEIDALFADPESFGTPPHPSIHPDPGSAPSDPYLVDVYAHTLRHVASSSAYASPSTSGFLLQEASWQPQDPARDPPIQGAIGNGVFPGAFDSLRVGDFDGDSRQEAIFGNFDGFVEVLEERFQGSPPEPIWIPEYRSPPIGWNVQALDVAPLETGGDSWIVFGSAGFGLQKIRIRPSPGLGQGSYDPPVPFVDAGEPTDHRPSEGFLQWLFIADFSAEHDGFEVLVQDQFSVWFLYDRHGAFLAKTERSLDPGGLPDNVDPGSGKPWIGRWPPYEAARGEIAFVPGGDGRLRRLSFEGSSRLRLDVCSDDYRGMGRCASVWAPSSSCGPFVLVGSLAGRGPDPDDPQDDGHQLTVIDPQAPPGQTLVAQFSGDGGTTLNAIGSIEPYGAGSFLLVHRDALAVVDLSVDSECEVGVSLSKTVPHRELVASDPEICAVERYGGRQDRYLVTTPNGRLWVLNHEDLSIARTTKTLETPPGSAPLPFYSNRSFGHTFTADQRTDNTQAVWIDDLGISYAEIDGSKESRLARLHLDTGEIDDWFLAGRGGPDNLGMTIDQSTGGRGYFVENGDFGSVGPDRFRYTLIGPVEPRGGYIQQLGPTLSILQNFDIPVDDDFHESFTNSGGDTTPWPYAENPRFGGQVTQAVLQGQRPYGNTVRTALLRKNPGDISVPHVIVGTTGGYVYAVDPAAPSDGLSFYTDDDLGWAIIGMDVGDVDGDGREEIVVGSWVDTSGYQDIGDPDKHRGHLYVLDTVSPGPFVTTAIDIQVPERLGAGVFGVRLDDIDGDGDLEIWVTDARGYLHALARDSQGDWECVYRSEGLGMYAGMYNQIWPYKDGSGQTTWLGVGTPGYLHRFEVDPSVLP